MAKVQLRPSTALAPVPAVMVSCGDFDGDKNIITLAWVGVACSDPPVISIAIRTQRHSYKMVKEAGEFVVNVAGEDLLKAVDLCGNVSGRDVDKFEEAGLTAERATQVKAPLIKECPLNLECKVIQSVTPGVHEVFLGQVVAVHADESVLSDKGRLDIGRLQPIAYAGGDYWSLGKQLEDYGFSRKRG